MTTITTLRAFYDILLDSINGILREQLTDITYKMVRNARTDYFEKVKFGVDSKGKEERFADYFSIRFEIIPNTATPSETVEFTIYAQCNSKTSEEVDFKDHYEFLMHAKIVYWRDRQHNTKEKRKEESFYNIALKRERNEESYKEFILQFTDVLLQICNALRKNEIRGVFGFVEEK